MRMMLFNLPEPSLPLLLSMPWKAPACSITLAANRIVLACELPARRGPRTSRRTPCRVRLVVSPAKGTTSSALAFPAVLPDSPLLAWASSLPLHRVPHVVVAHGGLDEGSRHRDCQLRQAALTDILGKNARIACEVRHIQILAQHGRY